MTNININEVLNTLHLLTAYPSSVAWQELTDHGNPCYSPYMYNTLQEEISEALTIAAVRVAMPKKSKLHLSLSSLVAVELQNKWVSYDWLIKACGRLLTGNTYSELQRAISFSNDVRNRMQALGLKKINSLREVYN